MTAGKIRAWLRRTPLPASVRADGREVAIPPSPSRWADLAETLEAMAPGTIEALGQQGEVLRVLSMEPPDCPEAPDREALAEERRERDRVRESIEIARVISDASERAARLHAETYAGVLQRYESLLTLVVQRLTAAERGYQAALVAAAQAQAQSILDRAEAEATQAPQDPLAALASAAIPALLGSTPTPPPPSSSPPKTPKES